MKNTAGRAILALAAFLAIQQAARGQTASELLQKGIYTQETLGDLEGAMRIYRQVLATASQARSLAAQAQFRLALCLEMKGAPEDAKKEFQKVIDEYPEQKELVARSREHFAPKFKLQPAPWSDGEVHEIRFKTPAGTVIGAQITRIQPMAGRPDTWVIENSQYAMGHAVHVSRIEVERETMRPIASQYRLSPFGQFRLQYDLRQVTIQTDGKESSKKFNFDGPVYDNDETLYLLRRMPLAAGMTMPLKIVSPVGAGFLEVTAHVAAIEEVKVAAGNFSCYKVEISSVKQTAWISTDRDRYLVKMEVGPLTGELSAVHKTETGPVLFKDDKGRFSMTLPPGWLTLRRETSEPAPEDLINLLDPEGTGDYTFWIGEYKTKKGFEIEMREEAEKVIKRRQQELSNYKVRADSWKLHQIGGRPALSYIADYTDEMKRPMVDSATWVRSETIHAMFRAQVAAGEFEALQPRFEPVTASLQLR